MTLNLKFCFSGPSNDELALVSDGRLVHVFDREEAAKAAAVQFGLIWIYGISFGKGAKKDKPARDFFEFISYYLWDMQPDTTSGSRKKRACNDVQKLEKAFKNYKAE